MFQKFQPEFFRDKQCWRHILCLAISVGSQEAAPEQNRSEMVRASVHEGAGRGPVPGVRYALAGLRSSRRRTGTDALTRWQRGTANIT